LFRVLVTGHCYKYTDQAMKRVVERLLNLLAFLLTAGRPVAADEIRRTVAGYDQDSDEAFRRMFERDKDLLRNMGIPLELRPTDAWEIEFGYVVPRDEYELPDPGLTDEERAALWISAQVVRLGGQPSGPEALLKLGGGAMSGSGEPLAADLGESAASLAAVFEAIIERQVLGFEYRGRDRRVHPYGLLHQRGHWYLIGEEGGEVRVFRVDRGSQYAADNRTRAFERPVGFRLREALPSLPWEAGEEDIEAVVHFDSEVAWWAQRQLVEPATPQPDGSLEAQIHVANPAAFIGWMLAFEDHAEIIGPRDLRNQLLELVGGGGDE
jgi:predicted DNA-binding transcriptional regulator YafY